MATWDPGLGTWALPQLGRSWGDSSPHCQSPSALPRLTSKLYKCLLPQAVVLLGTLPFCSPFRGLAWGPSRRAAQTGQQPDGQTGDSRLFPGNLQSEQGQPRALQTSPAGTAAMEVPPFPGPSLMKPLFVCRLQLILSEDRILVP